MLMTAALRGFTWRLCGALLACALATPAVATVPEGLMRMLARLDVAAPEAQVRADLARLAHNTRAGVDALMAERPYDYVSLLLAEHLVSRPGNGGFHRLFTCFYQQLGSERPALSDCAATVTDNLTVLFVPGWLYRSDTTTGADFAAQRARLTEAGIINALVPVKENGTVEENAAIVARTVTDRLADGERVLLVSASKGGPEAALALSQVGTPEQGQLVGWVNVGGLLGGTPLADKGASFPWSLFAKWVLLNGGSLEGIRSLTTEAAQARQQVIGALDGFPVINLVALPFADHQDERIERGFSMMEDDGPNDGMTLALDVIQPGEQSVVLPLVGLDHYFDHEAPGRLSLALVHTALALR